MQNDKCCLLLVPDSKCEYCCEPLQLLNKVHSIGQLPGISSRWDLDIVPTAGCPPVTRDTHGHPCAHGDRCATAPTCTKHSGDEWLPSNSTGYLQEECSMKQALIKKSKICIYCFTRWTQNCSSSDRIQQKSNFRKWEHCFITVQYTEKQNWITNLKQSMFASALVLHWLEVVWSGSGTSHSYK